MQLRKGTCDSWLCSFLVQKAVCAVYARKSVYECVCMRVYTCIVCVRVHDCMCQWVCIVHVELVVGRCTCVCFSKATPDPSTRQRTTRGPHWGPQALGCVPQNLP